MLVIGGPIGPAVLTAVQSGWAASLFGVKITGVPSHIKNKDD